MKRVKIILTVFGLLCCIVMAIAQTNPGDVLIGASTRFDFGYTKVSWNSDDDSGDGGTTITLMVSPQVGVFVVKGLAIGVEIPVSYQSYKNDEYDEDGTEYSLLAGPFIRYYFNVPKIKPFLDAAGGYGTYSYKYNNGMGYDFNEKATIMD